MEVSTSTAPASRLVPDVPLRVGSPIARATYDLMAGERIVHLDCAERERVSHATATVRRLLLGRGTEQVRFLANTVSAARELADMVVSRLVNYGDDLQFSVSDGTRAARQVGPRRAPSGGMIRVRSAGGHPTRRGSSGVNLDLAVIGFEDHPPRGLQYQYPLSQDMLDRAAGGLFALRGTYAHQVLVVGPHREWHALAPVLLGVVQGAAVPALALPWGPIPLDVMLAGAPQ